MQVASLELCRTLYELSGWNDQSNWHNQVRQARDDTYSWNVSDREGGYEHYPAYDLGFMLRKLPVEDNKDGQFVALESDTNNGWEAGYSYDLEHDTMYAHADTPEDAAAKLCCELIRNGILKTLEGMQG